MGNLQDLRAVLVNACVCVPFLSHIILSSWGHFFGAVHISVALHFSVIVALSDGSAGVTSDGVNTGAALFFLEYCVCSTCLKQIIFIARRVRPSLSLVNSSSDVGDVFFMMRSHGLVAFNC